jgi:hypothetical protein
MEVEVKKSEEGGSMCCENGGDFLWGVEEEAREFYVIGFSPNAFMNNDDVSICTVFIERILFFLDDNDFFVVLENCLHFINFAILEDVFSYNCDIFLRIDCFCCYFNSTIRR